MDDTMKISVKLASGTTYRIDARPLSNAQLLAMQMLKNLDAANQMRLISSVLRVSIGAESFTNLVLGMADETFSETDLTGLLNEIAKATGAARKAPETETLDVATPLPGHGE